jgi:phage shock protein E
MKKMHGKQLISIMLLGGLLFTALPAADPGPFADLTPAQAAAMIKTKGADPLFVILDVRTAAEFAADRIKGARNIDARMRGAKERIGKLDKNATYLLYCRGGMRSVKAMNAMKKLGFKRVYNLAGGLAKWQKEKLPVEGAAHPAAPPAK